MNLTKKSPDAKQLAYKLNFFENVYNNINIIIFTIYMLPSRTKFS